MNTFKPFELEVTHKAGVSSNDGRIALRFQRNLWFLGTEWQTCLRIPEQRTCDRVYVGDVSVHHWTSLYRGGDVLLLHEYQSMWGDTVRQLQETIHVHRFHRRTTPKSSVRCACHACIKIKQSACRTVRGLEKKHRISKGRTVRRVYGVEDLPNSRINLKVYKMFSYDRFQKNVMIK